MGFNKDVSHSKHTCAVIITIISACLTATSQCAEELRWQETAWGMGRSQVYDCADVNDIIQILNQAARLQSGSSPLAVSLENLAWTPAVKQSNCCALEWSRQKVTAQICSGCLYVGSWASGCPHMLIHNFNSKGNLAQLNFVLNNLLSWQMHTIKENSCTYYPAVDMNHQPYREACRVTTLVEKVASLILKGRLLMIQV